MRLFVLLASSMLFALPALAQQPAGTAAPASPTDTPKHNCTKPGEFPNLNLASPSQHRTFQKEYIAYVDCLKKFATDQQKLAEPHVKAANATADEYNTAVQAYNDYTEKLKAK